MLKKLLKNAHKKIKKDSQSWEFERLLITAHLRDSIVCISDFMYFDGFLSHYLIRYYLGVWYYNLCDDAFNIENKEKNSEQLQIQLNLPIKKTKDGVYLASQAIFEGTKFVNKFRKRFSEMFYFDYCKFPNAKIRTSAGKYKNIDMPLVVTNTETISWVVVGDKKAIEKLLVNVSSLGKKTSQGYGFVNKWTIESTKKQGTRGFACDSKSNPDYYGRLTPSYHNPNNQIAIKIDKF